MNPLHISPPLQTRLTAPIASFVCHRVYGHASAQELPHGIRQDGFSLMRRDMQWVQASDDD